VSPHTLGVIVGATLALSMWLLFFNPWKRRAS